MFITQTETSKFSVPSKDLSSFDIALLTAGLGSGVSRYQKRAVMHSVPREMMRDDCQQVFCKLLPRSKVKVCKLFLVTVSVMYSAMYDKKPGLGSKRCYIIII